ncbi:MAG: hypothetical protein HRT45_08970 [Bdellovibrionales bacterium]|nr:hypothetical protein [Bdellovibrionales bacterium]
MIVVAILAGGDSALGQVDQASERGKVSEPGKEAFLKSQSKPNRRVSEEHMNQFRNAKTVEELKGIPQVQRQSYAGFQFFELNSHHYGLNHKPLGLSNRSNVRTRSMKRTKSCLLYDVTYEMNENSHRIHPSLRKPTQSQFLIFSGGSFVFGEGLEANQTLPYYASESSDTYFTYNYGIRGAGTNTLLGQFKFTDMKAGVEEDSGVFVYMYLNFHLQRANGYMMQMKGLQYTPHFEKSDEGMIYTGSIGEQWSFWRDYVYPVLSGVFSVLGVHRNFPGLSSSHEVYVCDLIEEAKSEFTDLYPTSKFLVYLYPLQDLELAKPVVACLKERKISVLVSELKPENHEEWKIPFDGHPTAIANKAIAEEILSYLKPNDEAL